MCTIIAVPGNSNHGKCPASLRQQDSGVQICPPISGPPIKISPSFQRFPRLRETSEQLPHFRDTVGELLAWGVLQHPKVQQDKK